MPRRTQGTAPVQPADDIGQALGRAAARVELWKKLREEIATEIRRVVAEAHGLLSDLGHRAPDHVAPLVRSVAPPRPVSRKGGRRRGYKMSEATKQKLRAAWQRRRSAAGGTSAGVGEAASAVFQPVRRKGGRRKGYKMSEATKRKLRASWKRRKAAGK